MRRILSFVAALLICVPAFAQYGTSGIPAPGVANDFSVGTGGVAANTLTKLDSTGLAVVQITTSDTSSIGIAASAVSSGGIVTVYQQGVQIPCVADGTTVIGDIATTSTTVAGDCHDSGTASANSLSPTQANLGRIQSVATVGNLVQIAFNSSDARGAAPGSAITALTGDATASGPGSAALTLATVNSNVGSCGDSTHVAQVTLNAKGLATGCSAVTITGAAPTGAAGGVLSGTYPNPGFASIAANTVLANSTGSSAAPTAVTTLPSGLTIPSPTISGTVGGAPTMTGLWTFNGGLGVGESGFGTTGLILTSSSYPFLTMLNTASGAAARNYVLASSYAAVGDFALAQSNAKGGDPTAAGTVRLWVAPSGHVGINTTTDCGQVLCVNGTVAATSYTGTWGGTALTSSQIPSNVAYTGAANDFGYCCTQTMANFNLKGTASGNGQVNFGPFGGIGYMDIYGSSTGVYGAFHMRLFTPASAEIDPLVIQSSGVFYNVAMSSVGITDTGGLHETGALEVDGSSSFGSAGQTAMNASGIFTKVANVSTAGSLGVAPIVGSYISRGTTSAVNQTLCGSCSSIGLYRVSASVSCSTDSTSTVTITISYNDASGSTQNVSSTAANCVNPASGGVTQITQTINAEGSSGIQVQTTLAGSPTYDFGATVEQLASN